MIFADLALARRLERTEAMANARFIEARKQKSPAHGAEWIDVGGTYAMFDGVDSPLTQTFGLGMHSPVTAESLTTLEDFFAQRAAKIYHEVCPLADASAASRLFEHRYEAFEFTSVMYRALDGALPSAGSDPALTVREPRKHEHERWAELSAEGWSDNPEFRALVRDLGRIQSITRGVTLFFAEFDGQPIGTAAISIWDGVALFAGAATIPSGRRQGAQLALLNHRLRHAREHGCDVAMMGALPGSASQRNAQRNGFQIAYTRTKYRR